MKKFIIAVLALVMLLSVAAIASAAEENFTIYNVPCKELADSELYKHHGEGYIVKGPTGNQVEIRHRVSQVSADINNRIAAYCKNTGKTMGAGWKPANGSYYPHTSNAIVNKNSYTGAGRGNTEYTNQYGLTSLTITGSIKAN